MTTIRISALRFTLGRLASEALDTALAERPMSALTLWRWANERASDTRQPANRRVAAGELAARISELALQQVALITVDAVHDAADGVPTELDEWSDDTLP